MWIWIMIDRMDKANMLSNLLSNFLQGGTFSPPYENFGSNRVKTWKCISNILSETIELLKNAWNLFFYFTFSSGRNPLVQWVSSIAVTQGENKWWGARCSLLGSLSLSINLIARRLFSQKYQFSQYMWLTVAYEMPSKNIGNMEENITNTLKLLCK